MASILASFERRRGSNFITQLTELQFERRPFETHHHLAEFFPGDLDVLQYLLCWPPRKPLRFLAKSVDAGNAFLLTAFFVHSTSGNARFASKRCAMPFAGRVTMAVQAQAIPSCETDHVHAIAGTEPSIWLLIRGAFYIQRSSASYRPPLH